jgi:hypothetical protein
MSDDLKKRGQALENQFFANQEKEAIEKLKRAGAKAQEKQDLLAYTNVKNEQVLDDMVEHGINLETFTAVKMVPLVLVAWADNVIQDEERTAILSHLAKNGVSQGSPVHDLVAGWLTTRPSDELKATWGLFITEYSKNLNAAAKTALKEEILGTSGSVASAAGGWLLGWTSISDEERAVLEDLQALF